MTQLRTLLGQLSIQQRLPLLGKLAVNVVAIGRYLVRTPFHPRIYVRLATIRRADSSSKRTQIFLPHALRFAIQT